MSRIEIGPLELSAFRTRPPRSEPLKRGFALQIAWQRGFDWHLLAALDWPPYLFIRGLNRDSVEGP